MQASSPMARSWQVVRWLLISLAFVAVLVLAMMWLLGAFQDKVVVEGHAAPTGRPADQMQTAQAVLITLPQRESAVGTIRAVHETEVAGKILARVEEIDLKAGQEVSQGQVLVRLDDADLQAKVRQAEAALEAARSTRDQAKVEYDRVHQLFQQNAANQIEWDRAKSALKSAEAEVERAEQILAEARTVLDYATIRSPISGIVVDKKINAGDMVRPGQTLLTLYDPTRMQLVARVRESLAQRLRVDQEIGVRIDALDLNCHGQVSEIVPEAEAASRSFEVKVTGPCPPGVYAGMFGRVLIPLDEQQVLVIPRKAVRQVGQIDLVDVLEQGRLYRRAVQLGQPIGEQVQVLSGLQPGERVAVETPTAITPPQT